MKKLTLGIIFSTVFSFGAACHADAERINKEIEIKNGRLYFENQEALTAVFTAYADASAEELAPLLDPLYAQGFYSLRPVATEENEQLLFNRYQSKIAQDDSSKGIVTTLDENSFNYLDEIESVIGDDTFSALLNSDGEIQVADKIYKYTDVGLFYSTEENFDQVKNYLSTNNISQDLKIRTPSEVAVSLRNSLAGKRDARISSDISYFAVASANDSVQGIGAIENDIIADPLLDNVEAKTARVDSINIGRGVNEANATSPNCHQQRPIAGGCNNSSASSTYVAPPRGSTSNTLNCNWMRPIDGVCNSSRGRSSRNNVSSTPTITPDQSYQMFVSGLQNCNLQTGIWNTISNWFGENYVCVDKYEDRRRVKTKAFNRDYGIAYNMGVAVVHQYRGWTGFWRTEKTDEIRLVVEASQFEYDATPLINNALINSRNQEKAYYINNQKIVSNPNSINVPGPLGFVYSNLDHSSLPGPFQNTGLGLTFEFFGTGWLFLDNLIQNGIDSSLNAARLNQYFYTGLYQATTSVLQSALNSPSTVLPSNRTFVAKFPETGKVIIQKSIMDRGLNIGVRRQTFDWGVELKINSSWGTNGWSISNVSAGDQLIRPKNFRVKMIGAARRGGTWHGGKFGAGID
jgi:hypothetical protein